MEITTSTESQTEHAGPANTDRGLVRVDALFIDTWTGDLVAETETGVRLRIRTPRSKQIQEEIYRKIEWEDFEKRQRKLEEESQVTGRSPGGGGE